MQTGVKSAGCEKRIALTDVRQPRERRAALWRLTDHDPPSQEWKSMSPWVVLAWKLGAGGNSAKYTPHVHARVSYLLNPTAAVAAPVLWRNNVGKIEPVAVVSRAYRAGAKQM